MYNFTLKYFVYMIFLLFCFLKVALANSVDLDEPAP